jgi:hypothetical protein
MGFFRIDTAPETIQTEAGNDIIALSKSAFSDTPGSEWADFEKDIKKWLRDHEYLYCDNNGVPAPAKTPGGKTGLAPDDLQIVPVYDTDKRMHVRVPWRGVLQAIGPNVAIPYGGQSIGFPVLLARYFMRSCR